MEQSSKKLNGFFTSDTFPDTLVYDYMRNNFGVSKHSWNLLKVNTIYEIYVDAVENQKFDYYALGVGIKLREYISKRTGYKPSDCALVLYAIFLMVDQGKIKSFWLTRDVANKPINTIETIAAKISKSNFLPNITAPIKWGAILVIAASTLYFGIPIFKKIFK